MAKMCGHVRETFCRRSILQIVPKCRGFIATIGKSGNTSSFADRAYSAKHSVYSTVGGGGMREVERVSREVEIHILLFLLLLRCTFYAKYDKNAKPPLGTFPASECLQKGHSQPSRAR